MKRSTVCTYICYESSDVQSYQLENRSRGVKGRAELDVVIICFREAPQTRQRLLFSDAFDIVFIYWSVLEPQDLLWFFAPA